MVKIEFETDSAAFLDESGDKDDYLKNMEICRILDKISQEVEEGYTFGPIMDLNGNRVGNYRVD